MIYVGAENRQRIFIGIPIGKPLQQDIDRLLVPLKPESRNLRWVPAGNRHLTLAFLGDIPGSDIDRLLEMFSSAYQQFEPFHYCFSALERFPNARGRIIALTGDASGPLQGLATGTRDMLRVCGLGYERKKFRPHVTLARIRNPKHLVPVSDGRASIGMDVTRVVLYKSTLTETGAVYSALGAVDL